MYDIEWLPVLHMLAVKIGKLEIRLLVGS